MAKSRSLSGDKEVKTVEKKTRQGNGKRTKFAATSSNKPKKRSRGQGS